MSMNTFANPASAKQENFINSLRNKAANLNALTGEQTALFQKVLASEYVSKSEASYLITGLMKCEQKPLGEMAQPGYYVKDNGDYLVVVENKNKTATYAKRLEVQKAPGRRARARWVYAPGEGTLVAHMTPMTLVQAAKFGHLHGVCFVCCKALTDPASVQRGIGPVCAKKF